MPTEKEVYQAHAPQYERLICREDHQGNLLRAIEAVCMPDGLEVADLGAGTGRLARLLAPRARRVWAFDTSAHMLATASEALRTLGLTHWSCEVGDHRQIPLPDASVDLVTSGWSFCYLAVWAGEENWRQELEKGLGEMLRILRPGGVSLLFETLGTGHESPHPPQHLANYYAWLAEKGFQSTWIRTDYRFESPEEAAELTGFFFGDELAHTVQAQNQPVLPECTGVWWLKKA